MELEELIEAHNNLVQRYRNLMADKAAQGLLLDAMLVAMPPYVREAVQVNFTGLSERYLAQFLAHSEDPTDQAVHAAQASIRRLADHLEQLPQGR